MTFAMKALHHPYSHMLWPDHHIVPTLDLLPLWQIHRIILYDLFDQRLRNGGGLSG